MCGTLDRLSSIVRLSSVLSLTHTHTSPQKKHRYVSDTISAEDMGPSKYSVEQVHKIGLFDIRIFNLDRHAGNMLVNSKTEIVPIDHALCLPPINCLGEAEFGWSWWQQCKLPFSLEISNAILNHSTLNDLNILHRLGFEESSILTMMLSQLVLKRMVSNGLTLHEISRLFMRTSLDENVPSVFEMFVRNAIVYVSLRRRMRTRRRKGGVLTKIRYDFYISMFARILHAVKIFPQPTNVYFVGDGIRVACWM